ncbi:MAG: metal-dependent hydrolase [Gammaproteobacteria bacterium]|nr:metal-dependent hydrolase [Gammaproteobacteria bacterium]MBQ0840729.1 metal-dependent hydrolase [Gammaproteobacteria bacterium]
MWPADLSMNYYQPNKKGETVDPLSQALLGGVVAHAAAGRKLGLRAAGWGALAGAFPDVDVAFGLFADDIAQLQLHRGITHSLFFGPVVGSLAGWWFWRRDQLQAEPGPLWSWLAVFVLALLSHPLLDACTPYGTQLLAPFSDARFAWHAVPIIEPLYTAILLTGIFLLRYARRFGWLVSLLTLVLSSEYLLWGWTLNQQAIALAERQLARDGVFDAQVYSFPTFFQMPLRRVVAINERQIYVGFITLDQACDIAWEVQPRLEHPAIDALRNTRAGKVFHWFASGMVAEQVRRTEHGFVAQMADLRYGKSSDASRGMWGVRGGFDSDAKAIGEAGLYYGDMSLSVDDVVAVWQTAYPGEAGRCGGITAIVGT